MYILQNGTQFLIFNKEKQSKQVVEYFSIVFRKTQIYFIFLDKRDFFFFLLTIMKYVLNKYAK